MDSFRSDPSCSRSPSLSASSPTPPSGPSNDDIEAVIQMATSSRSSPDGRSGPLKDTRTQLFVGNLPYRVRWQDLKDLFRKAGTVLRADVSLGPDNRSRGYGTVLLATAEDAGRAIDMFHGYSWQTRILEVRPDRLPPDLDSSLNGVSSSGLANVGGLSPFTSSQTSGSFLGSLSPLAGDIEYASLFGLDRPSSSSGSNGRNLFVGNLPFHCQWQDLKDLFRQAGTIIRADVALGQDGRSRGFGTVVFATEYDAERAVKMFNGYEYNGRTLKVHYDKFSQSTQPMTTPTSPALSAFTKNNAVPSFQLANQGTSSRPNHIVVPSGYTLDFGPPSGPNTPFEVPQHPSFSFSVPPHTPIHLHQPQPQSSSQMTERTARPSLAHEMDSLSSSLRSMHVSSSSSTASSDSVKPSTSSSRSNMSSKSSTTTPISDCSQQSTSPAQPQSPSKSQSPNTPFHHHSHPHHPGTISIPPPLPASSFALPLHNMSPMGVPISPLYHPGMSPLHHPAHGMPMTPHGLPPITPSMPPFTFLPPVPLASPLFEGPRNGQSPLVPHGDGSSMILTPTYPFPPLMMANQDASYIDSNSSQSKHSSPQSTRSTTSAAGSSTTTQQPPTPGSPTSYFQAPSSSRHPSHHPSYAHHQLASHHHHPPHSQHPLAQTHVYTPFSPGLAMSPGAFWGRPGVAGAGPNPYINPAVGAPVHVHPGSPGVPTPGGTGGGYYFHLPSPGIPGSVGVELGSRGSTEPGGYFDSVARGGSFGYFPPMPPGVGMFGEGAGTGMNGMTGTGVESEIMKEKVKHGEDEREAEDKNVKYEEKEKGKYGCAVESGSEGTGADRFSGSTSPASGSNSESAIWGDGDAKGRMSFVLELKKDKDKKDKGGGGVMSRAHSMSAAGLKRPMFTGSESDPVSDVKLDGDREKGGEQ